MNHKELQKYREQRIRLLPTEIGVYALSDATGAVRYVGQTVDSIRSRVQRHTTSARSDIIANRLVDAGEIAFVHAYPVPDRAMVTPLETHLIYHFDAISPLMNGKMPAPLAAPIPFAIPDPVTVQIIPDEMLSDRQKPAYLIHRQIKLFSELTDYILNVKDNDDLRRSMRASLAVLSEHTHRFMKS